MCSIPAATLAFTIASAAVSAHSASVQGRNAQRIANYNAKVAEIQEQDARARGGYAANAKRQEVKKALATQNAQIAAGGLDTSSGASLTLAADTSWGGALDAKAIEVNAMREAFGYQTQAVQSRLDGAAAKYNGRGEAFGTLLSGAGRAMGTYSSLGLGSNAGSANTKKGP